MLLLERMTQIPFALAAIGAATLAFALPVWAQDRPESAIESLIDSSSTPTTALAVAKQQSEAGDISAAAATLERVLLVDRTAHMVRLTYVSLLCRLDDRQAAAFELTKLKGYPIDDAAWTQIQADCGPMIKP